MAIPVTGPISLGTLQAEFGGANPIALSEYYRNAGLVTPNNTGVPLSGSAISLSNFRGTVRALVVEYEIIGAGGAGGFGLYGGYGDGVARSAGGTASFITSAAIIGVIATGGLGGLNAAFTPVTTTVRNGEASVYGLGGTYGQSFAAETYSPGGDAPATSYGAGGGGGGGDQAQTYDSSGGEGGGGQAGTFLTGSFLLVPGTQLNVQIGAGGIGAGGNSEGGNGANGFARIRKGGGPWTVFTASGVYVV
jgi:hypothetical protein